MVGPKDDGVTVQPKPSANESVAPVDPGSTTIESELLDASDEGIVDHGDSVARVVRYSSVERRKWTDAKGAVTVVEVPREDVVLLPVSFQ
jgi:hypothetical protein